MGVLDGAAYRRRGMGILGVNVGRPIITNGVCIASCVEVRKPIELLFGLVSGMGPGVDVQNGHHVAQGKGVNFGVVCPIGPRPLALSDSQLTVKAVKVKSKHSC